MLLFILAVLCVLALLLWAVTYTYSGTTEFSTSSSAAGAGDTTQNITGSHSASLTFDPSVAPTISGFLKGTFLAAAGDLLLAHATDPLQGMGDATYPGGFAPSGVAKLKEIFIRNNDATNSVSIARGTTNGLPIFDAADDKITLAPGDIFYYFKKAGTAILTTGTNDKLTISVTGGTPSCDIHVKYGP